MKMKIAVNPAAGDRNSGTARGWAQAHAASPKPGPIGPK